MDSSLTDTDDVSTGPEIVLRSPSASRRQTLFLGRRVYNASVMLAGDILALTLAFGISIGLYEGTLTSSTAVTMWKTHFLYVMGTWSLGAMAAGLLPSWGLGPIIELRRTVTILSVCFGSAALLTVLVLPGLPPFGVPLGAGIVSLGLVPFFRLQSKRLLIGSGNWGIPAAIYGHGPTGRRILGLLRAERGLGYNPVAAYDDVTRTWHVSTNGCRLNGGTDVQGTHAPVAIVAQPDIRADRVKPLLANLLVQYQTVLIISEPSDAPSLWARPCEVGGLLGIEIPCNLTRPIPRVLKRVADLVIVGAALPVWGPLFVVTAGLIWLEDRESPFFFHERIGKDDVPFQTWKFRTMVPNAEAVLREHLRQDPDLRAEWKAHFKLRDDPRLTTLGRWLRRFSVDEIPQLVNVLRGEMSLVGPRPLPRYHYADLPPSVRDLRARVRPGLTGLWQVSGRSASGTEGMEQWDPYYVRNWSLWIDVVVLVRTVRAVIQRTGAY